MKFDFRVHFKRNKQFFDVFLYDVHPNTFKRKGGGRWGYFIRNGKYRRKGKFGEIHLVKSRIRHDTVAHELQHLMFAWYFCKWIVITPNNEEWSCIFFDELTRNFWKEYERYTKGDKI